MSLLNAALEYHRHKLPITLCIGKKPVGKQWQFKKWTIAEIEKMFRRQADLNVGVVLGPRSGIIDIESDSPEQAAAFAELFDDHEVVTPCFQSRRGKHRLFAFDDRLAALGDAIFHFRELAIRIGANGKAAQSLLPPSYADGVKREWLFPFDESEPQPIPDQVFERLMSCKQNPARNKPSVELISEKHSQTHKQLPVCTESSAHAVSAVCQLAIQQAIARTLPDGLGMRNRKLFDFARMLKSIPDLVNVNLKDLKPWVAGRRTGHNRS